MQREPVDSEALCSVGYDPHLRILEIEFSSGSLYRYHEVPQEVHMALMTAASVGEFFATHIRDAGFEYARTG